MANADKPNGAHAVRQLNGGSPVPANAYTVDASNATAIFVGDFIIAEADGNVAPYTGTGGGLLLGVCRAVSGDYDDLSRRYLPASTAGTIMVDDDPNTIFAIQEDDAGTALTATERFASCDVLATAGSTTTSKSAHEIDRSSITTTSGVAQLRLLRLVESDDNAYGDSAEWEVLINEHLYKTTAGV